MGPRSSSSVATSATDAGPAVPGNRVAEEWKPGGLLGELVQTITSLPCRRGCRGMGVDDRQRGDLVSSRLQLQGHLERHDAAHRPATEMIRSLGLNLSNRSTYLVAIASTVSIGSCPSSSPAA